MNNSPEEAQGEKAAETAGESGSKQTGATNAPKTPDSSDNTRNIITLRSTHTPNFHHLLRELGISLIVSTYQAGQVVLIRADTDCLNTLYRPFLKPMGIAVGPRRLAIGTAFEIWEFHDLPAVAQKIEPIGKHDACYLPRNVQMTGDIQIHEMAWAAPNVLPNLGPDPEMELWFINTRFSCLCTRSASYSFVPRWRPGFISGLAPEDRCHLNGLGMRGGRPRYVTALGSSNEPAGWRSNKKDGGILIDLDSDEIICRGLSMPHSPRWYNGKLWVLNSGSGTIGHVDLHTGKYEAITETPGFTRGFDFHGRFAFVGLSQVRETAVFSGISLTERLPERTCGVWVIDILSGQIVAHIKFDEGVQEIFAVQVLPGLYYPDLTHEDKAVLANSFVLPDESLSDVVPAFRSQDPPVLLGGANAGRPTSGSAPSIIP